MPDGDLADKWPYLDGYGERPCTLAELTARSKAREEAARVSQRISAEEAKAKTVPAAQEPERPAENQTADAQHRKLMRLSITIQASRKRAAEFLQSLELDRGLIFMPRMHNCERTRFADVEADARLQAAVEAGRCGRWLTADGMKWKADIASPRRRYSHGQSSRPPPSAADRAPAAGGWGSGAAQRLFPTATEEMHSTMQRLVTEMSTMVQQFTATVMNLQTKNQPTEATATPATAQAEIDQLKQALDEAKEIARNETHAAASKIRRQEDELQELRTMLRLAHDEITVVQSRLERLERPPPTRYTGSSAKKAVHPKYGGRPAPETSPVFAPTTPGWPTATTTGTGQPLQAPSMPFQFSPTKPQVQVTEQTVTPPQMPLATVPEAPTVAESTSTEVLPVMPQLATPTHQESQNTTKRHASESPGSVLSPLRPRQLLKGDTMAIMAYSAESYDTHFADQIGMSDTDPEFFDDDGSDSDQ
jgi:hypothetical protein